MVPCGVWMASATQSTRLWVTRMGWTFSSSHLSQVGVVEQAMLIELVFDVGKRELGAPHWDIQLREDPRQGSDMIFVTVGEDNPSDALTIFDEIGNVGYNDVDAQKFGLGKH